MTRRGGGDGGGRDGLLAAVPLVPGLISVGVLYGVTATDAGLPAWTVIGTSLLVATGTAQFVALELLDRGFAWWVIVAVGLLINLRFAVYGLHLAGFARTLPRSRRWLYLGMVNDEGYALTISKIAGDLPARRRLLGWSMAVMVSVWGAWQLGTVLGATAGAIVPDGLGLEMAIPLTLLTVLVLLTASRRHAVVAVLAGVTALALREATSGVGLVAGMAVGIAVGVAMSRARPAAVTSEATP